MRRDHAKSREVAGVLYRHSRQAAASSGLPVLEVPASRQRGSSFGERIANAFADAFACGYDRVIAVGGDCPRLHEVDWSGVARRLEGGRPVLGPTPGRDGTYLIGMTRSQFDRRAFQALPWQMDALFEDLVSHLAGRSGALPALLEPRGDVNGPEDLAALLQADAGTPIASRLRQILGASAPVASPGRLVSSNRRRTRRTRGPPAAGRRRSPRRVRSISVPGRLTPVPSRAPASTEACVPLTCS